MPFCCLDRVSGCLRIYGKVASVFIHSLASTDLARITGVNNEVGAFAPAAQN
jgi:hypothetical protein